MAGRAITFTRNTSPGDTLVDFRNPLLRAMLPVLLHDHTTGRNIIWATDPPPEAGCGPMDEITVEQVKMIQPVPRVQKRLAEQKERTRKKAEVFTPTWVCKKMADLAEKDLTADSLEEFVCKKCLEVTCGEAPFLTSRYDTVTGEKIPVSDRIGLLDRKLKAIWENEKDQLKQTALMICAYQSVYGYEYQGDNLLLARANLFLTFIENWTEKVGSPVDIGLAAMTATEISWNIWQMDGLKKTVPGTDIPCKIYDWKEDKAILFRDVGKEDE